MNSENYFVKLDGNEGIYSSGGECWIDGHDFSGYNIDFEKVAVCDLSPQQMIQLACVVVDHLYLNGHRFELRETVEQDQRVKLVCVNSKKP